MSRTTVPCSFLAVRLFALPIVCAALSNVCIADDPIYNVERISVPDSSYGHEPGFVDEHSSRDARISSDGRYVVFTSGARYLVPGVDYTNRFSGVYIRDRVTGVTELVNKTVDGAIPNASSEQPALSDDGRFVVYFSKATNIDSANVPSDNKRHVYLWDRETKANKRIDIAPSGVSFDDVYFSRVRISSDGNTVAFVRYVNNDPDQANGGYVFIYDRLSNTVRRLHKRPLGQRGVMQCEGFDLSRNGKYVVIGVRPSDYGLGGDDLQLLKIEVGTGAFEIVTNVPKVNGKPNFGPNELVVNDDASLVVYPYTGDGLPAGTVTDHYYPQAQLLDVATRTTTIISKLPNGNESPEGASAVSISKNSRYIAFHSLEQGYDSGGKKASSYGVAYVYDRTTARTSIASITPSGFTGKFTYLTTSSAVSDNGEVAFTAFDFPPKQAGAFFQDEWVGYIDTCPSDDTKKAPGACGCGIADSDSDQDGQLDCQENCATDPAKAEPGTCGCGTADSDQDLDGTLDCLDSCPGDPAKTDPGLCGCGKPETCFTVTADLLSKKKLACYVTIKKKGISGETVTALSKKPGKSSKLTEIGSKDSDGKGRALFSLPRLPRGSKVGCSVGDKNSKLVSVP